MKIVTKSARRNLDAHFYSVINCAFTFGPFHICLSYNWCNKWVLRQRISMQIYTTKLLFFFQLHHRGKK